MDDFLLRAMMGGVLLALAVGPLGAMVVWRHMAYFGDTIAHAALLGVAIALLSNVIPMTLAMFLVSLGVALALNLLTRDGRFHADTMLGMLAHGTLAIGVLLVAMSGDIQVDINAYLFGDILTITDHDLAMLGVLFAAVVAIVTTHWRAFILMTIDEAMARAEGIRVERTKLLLTMLLAATVAVSIKLVGVLLITAMLIIPAAAARYLARSPLQMVLLASMLGAVAVVIGLQGAIEFDAPAAPMMVTSGIAIFVVSALLSRILRKV
ncbi:MAG: metal ABC transporter permease [Rickettsiales bacterium]